MTTSDIAGLYSLVATCEANGVNLLDYLADVLLRAQDHPAADIDDLLPHRWSPRSAPTSTAVRLRTEWRDRAPPRGT